MKNRKLIKEIEKEFNFLMKRIHKHRKECEHWKNGKPCFNCHFDTLIPISNAINDAQYLDYPDTDKLDKFLVCEHLANKARLKDVLERERFLFQKDYGMNNPKKWDYVGWTRKGRIDALIWSLNFLIEKEDDIENYLKHRNAIRTAMGLKKLIDPLKT